LTNENLVHWGHGYTHRRDGDGGPARTQDGVGGVSNGTLLLLLLNQSIDEMVCVFHEFISQSRTRRKVFAPNEVKDPYCSFAIVYHQFYLLYCS
jgi:hypothetical protein